jgi:hydroxypyruvate reductase
MLMSLFEAALAAARPEGKFDGLLPPPPRGRTIVLGAGKAAARMAKSFEMAWAGPCEGLVITRYGHGLPSGRIEIVEAAHPVPDEVGLEASRRVLSMAQTARADDLVVFLVSGGASSLLTLPVEGMSLAEKQEINRQLLRSGAPIGAMNRVRKACSAIKGGRLAVAAAPAATVTFIISDVPGDDPGTVGSGPSIVEEVSGRAALGILDQYGIPVSDRTRRLILANGTPPSRMSPGPVHMIATSRMALEAAAQRASELGLNPVILGDAIEGEAREVAAVMAGIARSVIEHGTPVSRPCVLLSGGETTVTLRGDGQGGRNAEFLLALWMRLRNFARVSALAGDTDGIDGVQENAGAWFDTDEDAKVNLDAAAFLDRNDAYNYFRAAGRLIVTGPTLTNVNDFRAIIIR